MERYFIAITHKVLKNGCEKELARCGVMFDMLTLEEAREKKKLWDKRQLKYKVRIFKNNWEFVE